MISDSDFVRIIQDGIDARSLTPYLELAERFNVLESDIFKKIEEYKENKKIKRFGPVVSNRRIGMVHNAMVTLKISENEVDEVGLFVSENEFVTLCYQRKIVPNVWEYNLYFMVHGYDREIVNQQIKTVIDSLKLNIDQYQVLFSSRCFKQKGASYEK